jgi:signal transduction histidine kinase/CheY-like chemotaxis protein
MVARRDIAIAGIVMILGFLFSRAVGHSIAEEIGNLSHSVGRIAAGDFSARAPVNSEDELGQLAQAINAMASNIEHVRHNLEQARDVALHSARTKSEFIANMSREIESPLYTVMGHADVIEDQFGDDPDSGLAGHAEVIRDAAERLEATVRRMLDFSRIEAGTFELHPEPVSPAAMLPRQVRNLEEESREKGLDLQCIVEPDARVMIRFDEYCLSGALANLLSNAIKFTEKGSVVARLFRNHRGLRIEVRDTGIGIDRGHRMHLFEAFAKNEFGYAYRYQGSGLGLALTRSYLQLNRAGLTVDSTPGEGSTFTIEFPQDCEIANGSAEASDSGPAPAANSTAKPFTLVIDDDAGCRLLIKSVLGKNYQVRMAATADEAQSILESEREKIDLILCDVSRHDAGDGLELARELREDPRYDRIPIIGLSLNGSADDRARAYRAGCNGFVKKPVSSAHLLATVDRLALRSAG